MKKLNVAIIGQGRSGRDIHGLYFKSEQNTQYNVVAVVDAIAERRERAAQEYGCDVYADYRELFDRNDIDLVVNSTFSHMHAPVSIDLLEHGFNVVCEKPFAKNYEEGARVVAAAGKSGKMLNVFQQSRFAPYYTEIKKIMESGKMGEPIQFTINYSGFSRRWDWQTFLGCAAGSVRNSGPHPLDQALDILGFPPFEQLQIFSRLRTVNTFGDGEDYAKIMITAPNQPVIDLEISCCNAYSPATIIASCQYGSIKATHKTIDYKYYNPKTAPKHQLTLKSLSTEEGLPAYCGEKLDWTEEHIDIEGNVFEDAVEKYYEMIYAYLTEGREMEINPEQVLLQLKVIDMVHAQNPLPTMEAPAE